MSDGLGYEEAGVELDILDQAGNLVASQTANVGQTQSLTVFLVTGTYSFRLKGLNTGTAGLAPLLFTLQGIDLSDPQTPYQYDTTTAPAGICSGPSRSKW